MSEFHVRCVRIEDIIRHPNADTLSITNIDGGYPVIFKTTDWKLGDLAAYIPIDAVVPDIEEWHFLAPDKIIGDIPPRNRRIKAKRLRGIFSMGCLAKLPSGDWKVGDNLQEAMNVKRWEDFVQTNTSLEASVTKWYEALPWYKKIVTKRFWKRFYWRWIRGKRHYEVSRFIEAPSFFPRYTDIEGLRKYGNILQSGEEVIITEKIHGANFRIGKKDGKLWVGSHNHFRRAPEKDEPTDWFWGAVIQNHLEKLIPEGYGFFGEVYGPNVQSGFCYDVIGDNNLHVKFFDVIEFKTGRYLDYDEFQNLCFDHFLPTVPLLHRGPWNESLRGLSNGMTTLNSSHCREGFVVKPVKERFDPFVGRVILKFIGEEYMLRKEAA